MSSHQSLLDSNPVHAGSIRSLSLHARVGIGFGPSDRVQATCKADSPDCQSGKPAYQYHGLVGSSIVSKIVCSPLTHSVNLALAQPPPEPQSTKQTFRMSSLRIQPDKRAQEYTSYTSLCVFTLGFPSFPNEFQIFLVRRVSWHDHPSRDGHGRYLSLGSSHRV
jgi:hypothetical protein